MMNTLDGELVAGGSQQMITIGQLADYAGVTIKAVRHYHQRGLLEEPPRDASGYRRYNADHAIQLVKIKTLAEAGVPLARIKELLAADPDRFMVAIAEIDRALQRRAEELLRTRERIAQLRGGDRLFVSAAVADYLDRLRELGVSQRTVQMERDIWILLQSVSPKEAAIWIADKREAIGDPEFCALYLEHDAAFDWSPDDPRLPALADRTRRWMVNRYGGLERGAWPVQDPAIAQLVATSVGASSPAWDRLAELAKLSVGSPAQATGPGRMAAG
jgi:DNA-binding transcriptional MerR regulator